MYDELQRDLNLAGYPTLYNSFTPHGWRLDRMSVHQWIDERVPGGHRSRLGQLLDVAYDIEYGADTRVQSALNLIYLLGFQNDPKDFGLFGQSDEHYHIRGGNERLPNEVARTLKKTDIQTGTVLQVIEQDSNKKYRLSFRRGRSTFEVNADHVILTLPFSVLRQAQLPERKFQCHKEDRDTTIRVWCEREASRAVE